MKTYGFGYYIEGSSTLRRLVDVKAKNENEAIIKAMRFAIKNNLYIQSYGLEKNDSRKC